MIFNKYDNLNRTTRIARSDGAVIEYAYDKNSNRTQMVDPDGGITRYTYDKLDQLTKITDPAGLSTTFSYNILFLKTGMYYPNGLYIEYFYDLNDRLTSKNIREMGTYNLIKGWSYLYDNVGNRTRMTQSGGGPTTKTYYTYDKLYRIQNIKYPTKTVSYTYDAAGNRLTQNDAGSITTYTYNSANQLEQKRTTGFGTTAYRYTANGNREAKVDSTSGITNYVWDWENRLREVHLPTGDICSFTYDADGRRTSRTTAAGITTEFIYDGVNILKESEPGKTHTYVTALQIDDLISRDNEFYFTDGLGSVKLLADLSKNVLKTYEYDVWGKVTSETGTSDNEYQFTARRDEKDIALMYYRYRYYDPETGRFISQDPYTGGPDDARVSYRNSFFSAIHGAMTLYNTFRQPHTSNRYIYCHNNPINFTDPLGLWSGAAHDKILDFAFRDTLSRKEIKILQQSGRAFDKATQGKGEAHKHYMAERGETSDVARQKANDFINSSSKRAAELYEQGNNEAALKEFTKGAHTIMDSTSPVHTDANGNPQVWDPVRHPIDASKHSPNEFIGNERVKHLDARILRKNREMLRKAFLK